MLQKSSIYLRKVFSLSLPSHYPHLHCNQKPISLFCLFSFLTWVWAKTDRQTEIWTHLLSMLLLLLLLLLLLQPIMIIMHELWPHLSACRHKTPDLGKKRAGIVWRVHFCIKKVCDRSWEGMLRCKLQNNIACSNCTVLHQKCHPCISPLLLHKCVCNNMQVYNVHIRHFQHNLHKLGQSAWCMGVLRLHFLLASFSFSMKLLLLCILERKKEKSSAKQYFTAH